VRSAAPAPPSTIAFPRSLPVVSTTAVFPAVTSRRKRVALTLDRSATLRLQSVNLQDVFDLMAQHKPEVVDAIMATR